MRRISLILCLFIITSFLIGCQSDSKIPDGVSDEQLWKDSVKMANLIKNYYKNEKTITKEDDKFFAEYITKYKNDEKYYNIASYSEKLIIDTMFDATANLLIYIDSINKNKIDEKCKKELEDKISIMNEYIK